MNLFYYVKIEHAWRVACLGECCLRVIYCLHFEIDTKKYKIRTKTAYNFIKLQVHLSKYLLHGACSQSISITSFKGKLSLLLA